MGKQFWMGALADRRDPLYDRRTLHLQFPSAAAREMDYLNAWRRRHSNGWCSEVRELDEGLFILVAIDRPGQELLHAASYENLKAAAADELAHLAACCDHRACHGCGDWEPPLRETVTPRVFH